jgi:hypothetical protein
MSRKQGQGLDWSKEVVELLEPLVALLAIFKRETDLAIPDDTVSWEIARGLTDDIQRQVDYMYEWWCAEQQSSSSESETENGTTD